MIMKTKIYFWLTLLSFASSMIFQSCSKEDNTVSPVVFNGDATNGYVFTTTTTKSPTLQINKISIKSGDFVVGYFEVVTSLNVTSLAGTYTITDNPTAAGQASMGYYTSYNTNGGSYIRQQSERWYITSGTLTVTNDGNNYSSFVASGLTAVRNTDGAINNSVSINLAHVDGNVSLNYTSTETIVYPTDVPLLHTPMPGVQRHIITLKSGTTVSAYFEVIKPYLTTTAVSNSAYTVTAWNLTTTAEKIMGGYSIPAYYLTGGSYILVSGVKKYITSGNLNFALGLSNSYSITGTAIGTVLADGATTGTMDVSLTQIGVPK